MEALVIPKHDEQVGISSGFSGATPIWPWPALVIMVAAFLVVTPFFFLGNPSGHDFEFHLFSWMEVLGQWKQGIIYPRWAALAHWGYGEARFLFYPPASWILGAALGAALPWRLTAGAYIWVALTASGLSMFVLARRWLATRDAIFAAALYAVNPYYIVIVYWRSALAELLAGALLPLLLHFLLRARGNGRRIIIPLALTLAAVWLTNAPSSVMANYSLVLLLIVCAVLDRSPRILIYGGVAIVLGAALAAFYLLPAAYEEKWVNIAEVLSPGVRPQDNFLFTNTSDPDHNRFNLLVSMVAVAEIVVVAAAAWISRRYTPQRRQLWWTLAIWSAATILLMFPSTFVLWEYLPKLRFVQLPWRWLLCLNVAFAVLVTTGIKRWVGRVTICVAMLAVIGFGWRKIQPPWWDTAADITEMQDAVQAGQGYEGTDEYVPAGADASEIKKDAPEVGVENGEPARVHIVQWQPEQRRFTVELAKPSTLILHLFNYPAWKAEVNDKQVTTETREVTGQVMVRGGAGTSRISISFVRTWDRTAGGIISIVAVLILIAVIALGRNRRHRTDSARLQPRIRKRVLIATTNAGKIRDFNGAAASFGVEIASVPEMTSIPPVVEDGTTFEANARKKAEHYSQYVAGEIVIADDSGLEVAALNGGPGVHSARYAAKEPRAAEDNADDEANNARLLRELAGIPPERRTARFVCVIAAARDGKMLAVCRGQADGRILESPRGTQGFGYDPLFFYPPIQKTFAEIPAQEKARYSHRGAAFRQFLDWYGSQSLLEQEERRPKS